MTIDKAYQARKEGKYQEALALYRLTLAEMPENAIAHEGVAICLLNLKDYTAAFNSAKQALILDSSLVVPHLVLGDVYRHQKKFIEANAEINRAVELQPNSATVIYAQGISLIWKNKTNDAIDFFMKAIEIDADSLVSFPCHLNLGYIYQQKRDFNKAIQEYQFAYNLRPSRRLWFTISGIKYRWIISVIFTILLFAILGLSIVFDNGLLFAIFFVPLFLMTLAMTVSYAKQKKVFWVFVAGSIASVTGWLIYRVMYIYFTK